MAGAVDIANLALGRIGSKHRLSALTDTDLTAKRVNAIYPNVRDRCLQAYEWPWAESIQELALSDVEIPGWTYAYQYPEKCLRLTAVCDEAGARLWSRPDPWREPQQHYVAQDSYRLFHSGNDDDATLIVTDIADAYLVCVRRVENVNRYPPLFYSWVAWELAAELAMVLEVDPQLAAQAIQMARTTGPEAAAASFNEAVDDAEPDSPSIRARG